MAASLKAPTVQELWLPRLIGHRGEAARAPENTLASMRMAAASGLRWVEFDAKLSGDGVPLLFHDDTLDRTTNGEGPVAVTPFAAIRALDAGSWFGPDFAGETVPTLLETLALLVECGMGANVEIKPCPGREMETASVVSSAIEAHWPADYGRLIVSSFSRAALARARDVAPGLPRGLVVWDRMATMMEDAAALDCVSIHCAHQHLTREMAYAVKAAGYILAVYTVNDPALAHQLIEWGVDTIISDDSGTLGTTVSDSTGRASDRGQVPAA
ncbi:MAG: glycerophosphodiester phosphodiesterase [Rhodospirillaceae bacterium]|nr:glycerophosphodiester phosphodiesterase [Rhodospirillaceae bacterium]